MSERATAAPAAAEAEKSEVPAPIAVGPGVAELQALMKQGVPDLTKVIDIIDRRPGEHQQLMDLVKSISPEYHKNLLKAMDAIRIDLKRKAIAAGDPNDPQAGYFVGSAEEKGARWRTGDGKFQGKANKDGLDATYKIDDNDALVAHAAGKEGSVAWQHDGKTVGELYGRKGSGEWDAGLRRKIELGDGASVTPMLRHHQTAGGGQAELAAEYKDASTTATGYAGVRESGGGFVAGASATHKIDDASTISGSLTHEPGKTVAGVSGTHRFSPTTTGDAALTRTFAGDQSSTVATAGLQYRKDELSADGRLTHTQPDHGQGQTTLSIHERYQSSKVIQTFNLEAGAGTRDYATANAAVDMQLAPNVYAGAFGGFSVEGGKQSSASIGASITWTPAEKVALTAAGVMNSAGQIDARLQLDVFKSRVGLADIADHRKKALFSIYAGISTSGGGSLLDERYGAGSYKYNGNMQNDTQFQLGVKIPF